MQGKTQEAAAAAAGFSQRTARRWNNRGLPSDSKKEHNWRTRPDPFAEVFETQVVPLLQEDKQGKLQAKTVLRVLQGSEPERFKDKRGLRTLQRRMKQWRALHGPAKEVYFEQQAEPGHQASFDFTDGSDLCIVVAGMLYVHKLFELVLCYSGWRHVQVVKRETFEALLCSLQRGLMRLGGVPKELRSDNLSAAVHKLRDQQLGATKRWQQVLDHFGVRHSRIQPGKAHENGVAEQAHRRTLSALEQALIVRQSREFESVQQYEAFVAEVVQKDFNTPVAEQLAVERPLLLPLPQTLLPEYTPVVCKVRKWSTIRVLGKTYSVSSRLIGQTVTTRLYLEHVEVYLYGQLTETMERIQNGDCQIDYRHVIESLVKKPGAFARYRYREEMFPTLCFRRAYDALRVTYGERADTHYVRILYLCTKTSQEHVEAVLTQYLEKQEPLDYARVRAALLPSIPPLPQVTIPPVRLSDYDALLGGGL